MKMLDGSKDPAEFNFDLLAWVIIAGIGLCLVCAFAGGA